MSTWIDSSFLSKDRIIANPGFNRWLAAPAALAVHLIRFVGAFGLRLFLRNNAPE